MAEIKPEIMTQADIKIEDSSDSATMNEIASQTLDQVYDDHNAKDEDEKYVPPPRISPRRRLERSPSASSSSSSDGSGGGQASKRPRLAAGDFEAQQERWHSKEEPDVEPPTLKFEPKHPPGPRIDTTVNWSPLSLFKLFFSSSVQHTIINNTNGNAARRLAQGKDESKVKQRGPKEDGLSLSVTSVMDLMREVLMREMVEQAKAIVAEAAPRPSLTNTCMPVYRGKTGTQDRRKCVVCATKAKQMPGSKAKEMKTPIYCSKCNVSLCLVPERNCFLEYHGMVLQTE
ncbi:hypothetical protein COCON_G00204970 [Conger conger]|uniref:Uncharacterized protein n=1 Tax=Conger conger TaxID=82655 RepID=A0A9Q1CYW3_CONCO|nr:hypothetical protein COCON_G00204970 [Conger conger]